MPGGGHLGATLCDHLSGETKFIAHIDPATVLQPEEVAKQGEITVPDLRNIFAVAWTILNHISVPYWDVSASLKLLDIDDFEHALNFIEREKKRQIAAYEAESGPFPGGSGG